MYRYIKIRGSRRASDVVEGTSQTRFGCQYAISDCHNYIGVCRCVGAGIKWIIGVIDRVGTLGQTSTRYCDCGIIILEINGYLIYVDKRMLQGVILGQMLYPNLYPRIGELREIIEFRRLISHIWALFAFMGKMAPHMPNYMRAAIWRVIRCEIILAMKRHYLVIDWI